MNYTIRGKQFNAIEREVWALAERNQWEPETFDVLDKYIVPGKIFIDIGAWCGILSLYAEALGAEVHAIEPDPVAYVELFGNTIETGIFEHEIAIADNNKVSHLGTSAINGFGNSESSFMLKENITDDMKVNCYTLETFIVDSYINPANICLIKMDVEGSEVMILKQAASWLAKHKPPMWISFHPGYFEDLWQDIEAVIDTLEPYDFSRDNLRIALSDPAAFHTFLFLPK